MTIQNVNDAIAKLENLDPVFSSLCRKAKGKRNVE
jgi:hypothetical protein